MEITELETNRLVLRQWKATDLAVFAELNADPEVMAYFPNTLSQDQSDAVAHKCKSFIAKKGWGFWAVELKSTKEFIGFVGLYEPDDDLPCSPCVEIGWRLLKQHWGNGYATEAANTSLDYAFNTLNLDQVVSFTAVSNKPSRAVMERIGMQNSQQNFMHPALAKSHPLAEHVFYALRRSNWLSKE